MKFGGLEARPNLRYPILCDYELHVSKMLGMVDDACMPGRRSGTSTARAVILCDISAKVLAVILYPMSVGRSVAEVMRLVDATLVTGEGGFGTPVDWTMSRPLFCVPPVQPGDIGDTANETVNLPSGKKYMQYVSCGSFAVW